MRFNEGQRVRVLQRSGGIRPGEVVTITDAYEKANVEIYRAEIDDRRFGYFTPDMLEEVEVLPDVH